MYEDETETEEKCDTLGVLRQYVLIHLESSVGQMIAALAGVIPWCFAGTGDGVVV